MPRSLSAIVIAKNEQEDLPGCLESVKGLCGEIVVVVDEESADQTEAVARKFGCAVFKRAFDSYAAQKQFALDAARGEWVLSLDADERLSPELKDEIAHLIQADPPGNGFQIPFAVEFLGRRLRFGGVGGERHPRLFRKSEARFVGGVLHEGVEVEGPTPCPFRGKIIHRPYKDIGDYLEKLDRYTALAARKISASGRGLKWRDHFRASWEVNARLFLKLGVLDGQAGIIWAMLSGFHAWLKYARLIEAKK